MDTVLLHLLTYYLTEAAAKKWRGLINIHESWLYARSEFSNMLTNMSVPWEH